jgi:hypothetical protein
MANFNRESEDLQQRVARNDTHVGVGRGLGAVGLAALVGEAAAGSSLEVMAATVALSAGSIGYSAIRAARGQEDRAENFANISQRLTNNLR